MPGASQLERTVLQQAVLYAAGGSGALHLSGSGTAAVELVGTGSGALHLSGSGTATAELIAAGTGRLRLAGSSQPSGTGPAPPPGGIRVSPPPGNPFTYPCFDLVGGEPIDALPYGGVSFGAPLNQPGSFAGQVSLAALSSAALRAAKGQIGGPVYSYARATETSNTALFVDFAGTLVWGGILWKSDYDSADPLKTLKVGASEFGSYFQRRIQAFDYTATWAAGEDPMLVAQQVIEDAVAKPGTPAITLTLNPAGGEGGPKITPSYPGTALQTIDSIVSILSQMGYSIGFDYTFDCSYIPGTKTPQVIMNIWYPRKGRRAQDSQLVLLSSQCTFTYSVDGQQQANSLTETGSGIGTLTPARASVDLPGYPLLEETSARSQVNDEGTLAAVTLGDLGLKCYPVISPTFTVPVTLPDQTGRVPATAPLALGTFDRGDDFVFRVDPIAGGGQNTDPRFPDGCEFEWRINSWQCNVADKGLSTIVITAGVPPIAFIPPPQPPL